MRLIKLSFLCLALLAPLRLYADSDYKKHCAACHGEQAKGGFGPSLSAKTDKEAFKKIVRDGMGMMPAYSAGELSDKEIEEIYNDVVSLSEGGEDKKSIFDWVSGRLLARKNLRMTAWGAVFLMLAGFIFVLFTRYLKWSAFSDGRRYFGLIGINRSIKTAFTTAFGDALSVSSVYKKDKRRWFIHAMIAYGFIGLIIADILISVFNPDRTAMQILHPLKLFANICGISLLAGLLVVVYRLFTDPYEDNGITLAGDIVFIAVLLAVVLSGFAVEAARYLKLPEYTRYIYFAHIILFILLFITAPFTRFIHIFSTFFFVLCTRLAQKAADGGVSKELNEEPAPGRHFKTERIAKDLFGRKTQIRYFP